MTRSGLVQLFTGLAVAVIVGGVLAQLLLRYVYGYDIRGGRIRFLLFGSIPLFGIPISEVREVRECSGKDLWKPGFALRFGNRLWGDSVVIQKRSGLFRSVIITPDDTREFIKAVQEAKQHDLRGAAGGGRPQTDSS